MTEPGKHPDNQKKPVMPIVALYLWNVQDKVWQDERHSLVFRE